VLDEATTRHEMTWVTDPAMLLAGEDPNSTDIRDAIHWVRVYRELIDMTGALLERSESTSRGMHHDTVHEAGGTQRLLRAQREQYLARYAFWRDRAASLRPHGGLAAVASDS
jgi:hypothetical protein